MKTTIRILLAALLALLAGCTMFTPPADLDVRTTRLTAQGRFEVRIRPLADSVAINRIHSWEIEVRTAAGAPVAGADIRFGGGMPQHFHGYPTQPRVTADLGNGRYRLDGVKFSMGGWWEMKLDIRTPGASDAVTFNTVVSESQG